VGAALIATGHTLDDQAETILMRLARGAGPSSLAAMAEAGPGPFVKPLLGIERDGLREWLRKKRLPFRDDPSNQSLAFDRNRVRHLVVPLLAKSLNPAAARHLVEAAARLREDAALLDSLAQEQFASHSARSKAGLTLDASALGQLPHPLAARVARIALEAAGCDPRRISSRHVEALVGLARPGPGSSLDLPCGIVSRRRGRLVEFRRCDSPAKS
jgi:tRNA(Ile)-lysidine synthase TilS/MesJ